ncbi:MAG: trimethylamine methyltransferase family protein [Massiliimalia sp.]|jgi:trimethylamine--corrinoid protein Co-methyltransferase
MKSLKIIPDLLTNSEKELIHEKSLNILQKVGIKAPYLPFLELLEQHGAIIDKHTYIAKFPKKVIQKMVDSIEKQNPPETMKKLQGNISTEIFLVDLFNKSRRLGKLEDIKKGIALVEHLSEFPTSNAVVVPSDVPSQISDVESFFQLFAYSKKPGTTYILSPFSAEYIIEMSNVIGRPISYGFQCLSPFQFTTVTLQLAMLFFEKGLLAGCGPFAMSMVTSPVTPAGALLTQNAEQLACWFCNTHLNHTQAKRM